MQVPVGIQRRTDGRRSIVVFLSALLLAALSAKAQSNPGQEINLGNIHRGLGVGIVAGGVAVAGVAVTYLIVHNRGIAVGCIAESRGKRIFVGTDKVVYTLSDSGPSLPVGKRAKLKGHKSGPAASRTFEVDRVMKVYAPCTP